MSSSTDKREQEIGENFVKPESTIEETTSAITKLILKDDDVEQESSGVYVEPSIKFMPTLPETFKSLVGCPISIKNENKKPRDIIALLGNALGVNDYETNMASFWFLDFIALQVLRYENGLDDHGMSVMVSWLAGEMKFIRENNFSHEAFIRKMEDIFRKSFEKISHGQSLPHWDFIAVESKQEKSIIPEETMELLEEPEVHQREFTNSRSSSKMYGDSFHYALIAAAFLEPVRLRDYKLPFALRAARPLKIFEIEKNTRGQDLGPPRRSKEIKKKKSDNRKAKKSRDTETMEIIQRAVTPIVLSEEEILMNKRRYILPLMEANEAFSVLETCGK